MTRMPPAIDAQAAARPWIRSAHDATLSVEMEGGLNLSAIDSAALDALIDSRPDVGVFLSPAWLSGYFSEPPAGLEPSLVLLRHGTMLVGVAPVGIRRTLMHTTIGLLGGGLYSDRVDLLAARGYEAACADAFLAWAAREFDRGFTLRLRDVPAESPLWGAIHRAGAEHRLSLAFSGSEIHTHPYLELAMPSARAAAAPRPALVPESLDKHRRWLARKGDVRIQLLHDADAVANAFETLVMLLHARWGDREHGSTLDRQCARRFHRYVLPRLLREGRLRMIRLSVDERTVGVFYGLACGRWWGYYLAGYDRAWAGRIRLGLITLTAAIELAALQGSETFDFLKGADRMKYEWPVRERATIDGDVCSAHAGPQLERAARAARDVAAACVKTAGHLVRR